MKKKNNSNLKSSNKRLKATVNVCSIICLLTIVAVLIKVYVIGNKSDVSQVNIGAVSVENNKVKFKANITDSKKGVTRFSVNEKEGVVKVNMYTASKTIFSKNEVKVEKEFSKEIKTLYIDELAVWDNGKVIDEKVAKLFNNRISYIGSAFKVKKVINSVGVNESFNEDGMELQTSKEPYGLTIFYKNEKQYTLDYMKSRMEELSCAILACIENASEVKWIDRGNVADEYTVSLENANKLVGENVKECSKTPSNLQKLMEKLNLVMPSEYSSKVIEFK